MRVYPERGDLVHVCEGGIVWKHDNGLHRIIPVVTGADLVCLGRAFEWADVEVDDYRTNRPSVWVKSGSLGIVWVEPSSWVPVEGPPVLASLVDRASTEEDR